MKYDFSIDLSEDTSMALILRQIKPNSIVLEFGTATGYMTRYMKEVLHCTVFGVELEREAAAQAAVYTEKMVVADLDELTWVESLNKQQYDYIIFADVLEHLRDPWRVLREAALLLNDTGTMLTSIPNIGHNAVIMELLQGRFPYQRLGLLDDTHIRFFTQESVRQLLKQAGLQPIKWMNTRAMAEQTELKGQKNLFIETFQALLTARPDGEIYQFVTASKKITSNQLLEAGTETCYEAVYLRSNLLQLFWSDTGEYTEEQSQIQSIFPDDKVHEYEFLLPEHASGKLRIDPGSKPAYIDIETISLYRCGKSEELIRQWDKTSHFAGLRIGGGLVEFDRDKTIRLVSLGKDPQCFLEDVALAKEQGPFRLLICMKVDAARISDSLQPLYDTFAQLHGQVAWQHTRLAETEQALREAEVSMTELKHRIDSMQTEMEKLLNSVSWRITKPCRDLLNFLRRK